MRNSLVVVTLQLTLMTAVSAQVTPAPEAPASEAKADAAPETAPVAFQPPAPADAEVIVVVGTRAPRGRTITESPVAIDVIKMDDATATAGQLDLNQLLHFIAPSFNANRQSGADGADHIDPATLRGLGPDQTLVLINGKRRHQSSLVNIFGTRGRGNTGTDLNAIPLAAIDRIEILRDGAAAQYGSDALAGVVNIILKSNVERFRGSVTAGAHNAKPPGKYDVVRDERFDGEELQLSGNYGVRLGDDGFVNLSAEYLKKGGTNRSADAIADPTLSIYRRQFGDAALDSFGAFFNAEKPFGKAAMLYTFGGYSLRDTDAFAWTRFGDDERNTPAIYPDGFDPHITSRIIDRSLSAGVKTTLLGWHVDFNNTYGSNRFHYIIDGTLNASLLEKSPTRFDAGGHEFSQNTTGVTASRLFAQPLAGASLAFGVESRIDHYGIFAGEEGSYRNYGIVPVVVGGDVVQEDRLGRAAGSQGFPGFQPANEVDELRSNQAAFVDTEIDILPDWMVGAAARFENYSDFGTTLNGKLASRVTLDERVTVRASVSTGFRAPSLAQIHYNTTFTDFVSGVATDKIIAKNNSPITRALGIPQLEEERSLNGAAGVGVRFAPFTASIDGYYVEVKDRIVLTGAFEDTDPEIGPDLQALDVSAAQFFTNAIDTRTVGVDAVLTYADKFGPHSVRAAFAGNINHMRLLSINTTEKLDDKRDTYFGRRERYFLRASAPPSKLTLALDYAWGPLAASARVVRFDRVILIDWLDKRDVYAAAFTIDATLSWTVDEHLTLHVGATNLYNAYPTQQNTETETGGLWDPVQMGFSGAFYFSRLTMSY